MKQRAEANYLPPYGSGHSPLNVRQLDDRYRRAHAEIAEAPPAARGKAIKSVTAYIAFKGVADGFAALNAYNARLQGLPHDKRLADIWWRAIMRAAAIVRSHSAKQ